MNEEEYEDKMQRIEELTAFDPYPDTVLGQEIDKLVGEVAAYQKEILKQVAVAAGISGDFKVFKLEPDKDLDRELKSSCFGVDDEE